MADNIHITIIELNALHTKRQNLFHFFFQAEDGIRDLYMTGVQTCALPISLRAHHLHARCGLGHRLLRPVGSRAGQAARPGAEPRRGGRRVRRRRAGRLDPSPHRLLPRAQVMNTNPLRDPQDRRLPKVAGPCGMVIFGVTGDLARKKLMPAIYDLANRGLLPPGFSLVGFARRDWADEDFAQVVHDAVKQHSRTGFREEVWSALSEGIRFVPGEFADHNAFDQLRSTIEDLDKTRGTGGNHAFYLSVPPKFFPDVVQQLKEHGLADGPAGSWRRVVI